MRIATKKELKPCPFCGGEAILQETGSSWCNVICDKCGAMTKCILNNCEYSSKDKAIEAWNRRAGNENINTQKAKRNNKANLCK